MDKPKMRRVKPIEYDMPRVGEGMEVRLTIPLKSLPEAKDWKVGEKYHIELDVTQEAISKKEVTFMVDKVGTEEDEDDYEETESESEGETENE